MAAARELARDHLIEIRKGADPVATRLQKRRRSVWTFEKVAAAYIDGHRAEWKNAKHAAQWESTLSTYCYPIFGHKHVADVTKADVLAVIEPLWLAKNETASRLRGRIGSVLTFAMQREYRPRASTLQRCPGWRWPGRRRWRRSNTTPLSASMTCTGSWSGCAR